MSFILSGTGKLTVDQVNKFFQTHQGAHGSLANQNTPEAKAFMKRLQEFQAVKDKAIGGARYDTLTDVEADRVRTAAARVSDAKLAAQRSQIRTDATPQRPDAKDPYQDHGRYRQGPSTEQVRFERGSFKEGDMGPGVKDLQKQLLAAGYDLGPKGADGYFGPKTAAAAKKFLAEHKDLQGQLDARALERAAGVIEGMRSER